MKKYAGFLLVLLSVLLGGILVQASSENISVLRNTDFDSGSFWTNSRWFTIENNTLIYDSTEKTGKRWLQQDILDTVVDKRTYTAIVDIELETEATVWVRMVAGGGINFFKQVLPAGRHTITESQYLSWRTESIDRARFQILVYDEQTENSVPFTLHAIDLTYTTPMDLLFGLKQIMSVTEDTVVIDGALQVESLQIGNHKLILDEEGNLCIGACNVNVATTTEPVATSTDPFEEEQTSTSTDNVTDPVGEESVATSTDPVEETSTSTATSTIETEEEVASSTATSTDPNLDDTETSTEDVATSTASTTEPVTEEPVATSTDPVEETSTSTASSTELN